MPLPLPLGATGLGQAACTSSHCSLKLKPIFVPTYFKLAHERTSKGGPKLPGQLHACWDQAFFCKAIEWLGTVCHLAQETKSTSCLEGAAGQHASGHGHQCPVCCWGCLCCCQGKASQCTFCWLHLRWPSWDIVSAWGDCGDYVHR